MYFLFAIACLAFTSCKPNTSASGAETEDEYKMEDTTAVDGTDVEAADTTAMPAESTSKETKLPDTISVKTVHPKVDTSNKFALAGTKWRLVELNGREVKNTSGKEYVLTLNSKTGKITSYMGCNSIMGSYLMKDEPNSISFLYVGATKMACPDMKLEEKYMKMLQKVDNYMIEGNMLHLHKGKKEALAKLEAM